MRPRALLLAGIAACADLGGLAGGRADSGAPDDAALDASPVSEAGVRDDASPPADGGGQGPPVLASTGAVAAPSGAAQQTHLVRTKAGRSFVFYLDDAKTSLHARTSTDFVAWTGSTDLTLPVAHSGDGRNFSVAYAAVGGIEVVHVSIGLQQGNVREVYHARGVLEATGQITYGNVAKVTQVGSGPAPDVPPYNGEAVGVGANGVVYVATGWTAFPDGGSAFNATLLTSTTPDTGAAWTAAFTQIDVEATTRAVNAHQLVTSPGAAGVGYFWEAADKEPDPSNVHGAAQLLGSWTKLGPIFGTDATESTNDWCAAPIGTTAYVARWTSTAGFETVSFSTPSRTVVPAPPNTEAPAPGNGVVLVTDGARLALAVISSAPGNPVRVSQFDGKAWGAWSTLVPAGRPRSFLSGSSAAGHAALLWTEAAAGLTNELSGAIVFE